MPGRYFLTSAPEEIASHLGCSSGGLNDAARRNVSPGQDVIVRAADAPDLSHMRWGIVPVGRVNARGRPVLETVINARSETVFTKSAFDGVRRCLVPADGWYEWTGKARRKTTWRITLKSKEPIVFAGIYDVWSAPNGQKLAQAATLTCEPNQDVADIHHRMGAILAPKDFDTWLHGDQDTAAGLLRPLEDGLLQIEKADDVDWAAP